MRLLSISDLHVTVDGKPIIRGLDLTVRPGEIHAIMGPNGSGKSTLVNTLMGHPKYKVMKGSATFLGKNLLTMEPNERACLGLFLAFQYPKEIAGVSLRNFLFAAYKQQMKARPPVAAIRKSLEKMSPIKFKKLLEDEMKSLKMDPAFAERFVNQGFSGGEKKKAEILQLHVLKPLLALLDETDSGLDVDALKIVAEGVNAMRPTDRSRGSTRGEPVESKTATDPSNGFSAVIVTHYARILDYITPDRVHVMIQGRIVESGGAEFARKLEKEGYGKYGVQESGDTPLQLDID